MSTPTLTQEQRATIAPHERHLHSAVYADHVVALSTTAATTLFDTYNAVFNAKELNKHCGQCVLRVCKRLGNLYFGEQVTETPTTAPNTTPADQPATPDKKPRQGARKQAKR